MIEVAVDQATTNLPQLVRRALSGEVVVLTSLAGSVRLQPIPNPAGERRIGGCPGFILWMADDFNEPLDGFREYMP
jgi:antitoxin (DNA-binding transcriptional repressor) of toxin-antitoxin stability system